ncbi:MAG: hypothetical protein EAZ53_10725 [Bacteroidetes bacterium]|nr:MAG: hypothetical protein EAZ53_10725 [Bacteroidota bacterium]
MIAFFIPPPIRNPSHVEYRKAQIAASSLLIILIALVLYSFYFLLYKPDDTTKNYTNLAGVGFLIGTMLLMRFSKSIIPSMTLLVFMSFVAVSISIYHTGGIYSVDISWLLLMVVTSCFFVNLKVGIIYSFCASSYIVFLYLVENNHLASEIQFSSYPNFSNTPHYVFTWVFIIIFLLTLTISFLKTLNNANQKIDALQKIQLENLKQLVAKKNKEIDLLRSKLAQDFHDEMANKLAGIRMLSETIAYKSDRNMLEKSDMIQTLQTIEKRSKDLYNGTKDFVWSIGSDSDNIQALFDFINTELGVFFQIKNIDFNANFQTQYTTLPPIFPPVSRQLIYIVKEICTNVSSLIQVENSKLEFNIKDDNLIIKLSFSIADSSVLIDYASFVNQVENRLLRIEANSKTNLLDKVLNYEFEIPLKPKLVELF